MKVRCPNCQKIFLATEEQEKLLTTGTENKQRLVMLECPECYKDPIDPANLLSHDAQRDEKNINDSEEPIECPICHGGIVSYIDNGDEKFWGCGECGSIWLTKKSLNEAISNSHKS